MSPKAIAITIFAGIASALCVMAAFKVGPGAVPFMLVAAFPIYVAALSQGTAVGVGASIMAIVVAATAMSPQAAVAVGLVYTIPASIIGHQANLAQENEQGQMEWFPLSRLFFNLCVVLVIGMVVMGFLSGYDPKALPPEMGEAVREALRQNPPPQPLSNEETEALIQSVFKVLPFVFAGIWLVIHVVNLHFASVICRLSGMMPRPKDDLALDANLPKVALVILAVSIVLAIALSGPLQLVSAVIAGVFTMAFALLGLAGLHRRARNNPAGLVMLIVSYIAILLLYPVIYLFSISGVIRSLAQSNNSNNPPPNAE